MRKTKKKRIEDRLWCKSCLRWIYHHIFFCPKFPRVEGMKKWAHCICSIHTCYDAKKAGIKRTKKTNVAYVDF